MISISRAGNAEDFEIAAGFSRDFGAWDAIEGMRYGVSPGLVMTLFHNDEAESLVSRYGSSDGMLLIARWDDVPAGSVAFEPLDEGTAELHKFYVDPEFRGKGIGRALMQAILAEIGRTSRRRILLHTTIYMTSAVSIYESFGFRRCEPFKPIPDEIRHTEVFMERAI